MQWQRREAQWRRCRARLREAPRQFVQVAGRHRRKRMVLGMVEHAQAESCQHRRARARRRAVGRVSITAMHHPGSRQCRDQVGQVKPHPYTLPRPGIAAPHPAMQQRAQHEFSADPPPLPRRTAPPAGTVHCKRVQRGMQQRAPQVASRDGTFDIIGGEAGSVMMSVGHRDRVQRTPEQQAEQAQHHVIGGSAQTDRMVDRTMGEAQAGQKGHRAGERGDGPVRMHRREQGQRESRTGQHQLAQRLPAAHRHQITPRHLGSVQLSHRRGPGAGAGAGPDDAP
ncbi:hypothetical protein [Dokdonella sp.]|uniref:hypothetical protein n=1 Tax=Dokdonella sp. TaxID=2291710 RepID=UPI0027BACF27|nr:hypothetical protein [Dokdonella sp.]